MSMNTCPTDDIYLQSCLYGTCDHISCDLAFL